MDKLRHAGEACVDRGSIRVRRFARFLQVLFILLFAAGSAQSHHGPKWIELHSAEIQLIAADDDNDGILNSREEMIGTDSDSADTDDDGFSDLFEDNYRAFGFDPLRRNLDSDRDGLTDQFETELGTELDLQDSDGDSFSDFDEVMNQFFGYDPLKTTRDSDFDGLADRLERKLGTSRRHVDSNGDGVSDFEAYYEGISPLARLDGGLGEVGGATYSDRMREAIENMRQGDAFPPELAVELPYPAVTRGLYGSRGGRDDTGGRESAVEDAPVVSELSHQFLTPSAALAQSGVAASANIPYITALYPTYNQIVTQLKDIALAYDGSPNAKIARLFYWSEPTEGHRWIYALKISDSPQNNEDENEMLFMGLHHGRELITVGYTMELIRKLTNGYSAGNSSIQARVNASEIWIIPIVNPDGYSMAQSEFAQGANVNWRKNIRKVIEPSSGGATQAEWGKGVDINRNYDFTHIRTLTLAQRTALSQKTCGNNGLNVIGFGNFNTCEAFMTTKSTYAGGIAFSDVESRSVRMLADDQFNSGHEIDSIRCSLSWHTGAPGNIIAPFNHDSIVSVSPVDENRIDKLGDAVSAATGFFYNAVSSPWWQLPLNYEAFGTSDDWLYTHNGILPLTVEGFPKLKGNNSFFPETGLAKKTNVERNMDGAVAFMNTCAPLRFTLP
jgi:hypothetical protein